MGRTLRRRGQRVALAELWATLGHALATLSERERKILTLLMNRNQIESEVADQVGVVMALTDGRSLVNVTLGQGER